MWKIRKVWFIWWCVIRSSLRHGCISLPTCPHGEPCHCFSYVVNCIGWVGNMGRPGLGYQAMSWGYSLISLLWPEIGPQTLGILSPSLSHWHSIPITAASGLNIAWSNFNTLFFVRSDMSSTKFWWGDIRFYRLQGSPHIWTTPHTMAIQDQQNYSSTEPASICLTHSREAQDTNWCP